MIVARTALASVRPSVGALSTKAAAARLLHTSRSVGDAAHGSSSSSSSAAAEEEYYPPEGFNAPIWRWTIFGTLATVAIYRWTSTRSNAAAATEEGDEEGEARQPWITRYLQYHRTDSSVWKENAEAHMDIARERARGSLILQSAERPEIPRLRFTNTFDQASPQGLPVGGQVDVSDVERA